MSKKLIIKSVKKFIPSSVNKETLTPKQKDNTESPIRYSPQRIAERLKSFYMPRKYTEYINTYWAKLHSLLGTNVEVSRKILLDGPTDAQIKIYADYINDIVLIRTQFAYVVMWMTDTVNHINTMK